MRVGWLSRGRFVAAEFDDSRFSIAVRTGDAAHCDVYLLPGFVDAHCHGYGGHDVMDGWASEVGRNLRARGVEWWCPTTVAAPWHEIRRVLQGLDSSVPGFAGAHLEGPFLSAARVGAQPSEHLRQPHLEEMQAEIADLRNKVRLMTLAPELPGALHLIRWLRELGVIPSAGHTEASFGEMESAYQQGLRRMTHFYNAMRPFHHRDPGCVGFGLTKSVTCELIYDKRHVSREAAALLWSRRGPNEVVAVSDGTKLAGLPDGFEAEMWGRRVRKESGAVVMSDGRLAGSGATIDDVFFNLWHDLGPKAAAMMCCYNPRRDLNLPEAGLWLLVDSQGRVAQTMEGELIIEG